MKCMAVTDSDKKLKGFQVSLNASYDISLAVGGSLDSYSEPFEASSVVSAKICFF